MGEKSSGFGLSTGAFIDPRGLGRSPVRDYDVLADGSFVIRVEVDDNGQTARGRRVVAGFFGKSRERGISGLASVTIQPSPNLSITHSLSAWACPPGAVGGIVSPCNARTGERDPMTDEPVACANCGDVITPAISDGTYEISSAGRRASDQAWVGSLARNDSDP